MFDYILRFVSGFLYGGPTFNLVTLIISMIGLAALPFTIWLSLRSVKNRRPIFLTRNTNLIRDSVQSFEEVSVMYENRKVPNLSVAKLVFWNAGGETIDQNDVVEKDLVQIRVGEGFQILSAKILLQNEITNNFSVVLNSKKRFATINFDYIDKGQGVILQILHTGLTEDDIVLSGSIKGCGRLQKIEDRPWSVMTLDRFLKSNRLKRQNKKRILGILLIMSLFVSYISLFFGPRHCADSRSSLTYVFFIIITVLYLPFAWSLLTQKVPRSLRSFYE